MSWSEIIGIKPLKDIAKKIAEKGSSTSQGRIKNFPLHSLDVTMPDELPSLLKVKLFLNPRIIPGRKLFGETLKYFFS